MKISKNSSKRRLAIFIVLLAAFSAMASSSAEDGLLHKANHWWDPIPASPVELKDNPLNESKVELGKMLFFDPRLSSSWKISCHTCHDLEKGGVDRLETSIGHEGEKGKRNSPTVYNAVFNISQFWDGRAANLREQVKGPVLAGAEMKSDPDRIVRTLKSIPVYAELFVKAFPSQAEPVTFDNLARAIEAFEATLTTPGSRFDKYLMGDQAALNEQEKRGMSLFISKDCVKCHKGINVGGASYHRFGAEKKPDELHMPRDDKGRILVTGNVADEYAFKTPTLRNIELTPPYFHSGKVWDLKEAVEKMAYWQLGSKLKDRDAEDITAFLRTLTGQLPKIAVPTLPPHTSGTPPPENGYKQLGTGGKN